MSRNDIVLRIDKLTKKGSQNQKLIAKWQRILRAYDRSNQTS